MYCENCGKQNSSSAKFCRHCGTDLAPVIASHSAPTLPYQVDPYSDPNARDYAWENSSEEMRKRRIARWESKESLGIFLTCVLVVAFIHGLSLVLPGLERLLDGPVSWLLVGGMAFGCVLKLVWDGRLGIPPRHSLREMVIVGAVVYAVMFGTMWAWKYYVTNVATPENIASLIPSSLPASRTPTVTTVTSGVSATVATAGLFMREGPGREYREVKAYAEGDVVKVVGKEPGGAWVKVEAKDGRSGWMSVRFLRLSGELERVPVVEVPPVPTPTKGG